jgi:hypothetical protein
MSADDLKLCIACRYYSPFMSTCVRPTGISPVDGTRQVRGTSCSVERGDLSESNCGSAAQYFEQRPPAPPPPPEEPKPVGPPLVAVSDPQPRSLYDLLRTFWRRHP